MSMDKTSLSKNNKYKKAVLWWLLCLIGLFILFVCIYFLAWGMMMQPKPSYQPQLSNKEERFFKALDKQYLKEEEGASMLTGDELDDVDLNDLSFDDL